MPGGNPDSSQSTENVQDLYSKFISGLKSNFLDIVSITNNVNDQVIKVAKSFGQGNENVVGMTKSLVEARAKVLDIGKDFNDIAQIQQQIATTIGRNIVLPSDYYRDILSTTEVTGQSFETLATNFKNVGVSLYDLTGNMQDVVDTARKMGVSAQQVSAQVLANLVSMNKINFVDGVDGLARMAAQAVKLRIDMKEVLNFSEKLLSPEKAIDTAAALQRLGVATSDLIDPLRLMDLSLNNPEELQKQIADLATSFVRLNEKGNFEILPGEKLRIRAISQEIYGNSDALGKMAINAAEAKRKMDEISFPEGAFTEEQQEIIRNMAEMKSGQYIITLDGKQLGIDEAISKLKTDTTLMDTLEDMATPKTMEELAKEQRNYLKIISDDMKHLIVLPYAISGSKTEKELYGGLTNFVGALTSAFKAESLKPSNLRESIDRGATDFMNLFSTQNIENYNDFSEAFKKIGGNALEFAKIIGGDTTKKINEELEKLKRNYPALSNFLERTDTFLGGLMSEVRNLATPATTSTTRANDFLMTPQGKVEFLPEDYFAAFTDKTGSVAKNLMGGGNNETSNMKVGGEVTINLNIDVSTPSNVNSDQIKEILMSTDVTQTLVKQFSTGLFDRDVPQTNPQRRLNNLRNQVYRG